MRNIAHAPIYLVSCISSFLRISVFILSLCLIPNLLCLSSCVVSCILRHPSYPCIRPVFLFLFFAVCFFLLYVNNHTSYVCTFIPCVFSLQIFPQSFAIIPVCCPVKLFLNFFSAVCY